MSGYFLDSISVEGFRGINNSGDPLEIKFTADTVSSIFARNGLGKSSLFDALTYALGRGVDKLERLQADEHPQEYYNNRFHPGDATIVLGLRDESSAKMSVRVVRTKSGSRVVDSPSGHPAPDKLLEEIGRDAGLLDGATFDRFVEDTPLKRGRSFASLLGHVELSEMRQALETLANKRAVEGDLEIKSLRETVDARKKRGRELVDRLQSAHERLLGAKAPEPVNAQSIGPIVVSALVGVPLLTAIVSGKGLAAIDFEAAKSVIIEADASGKRKQLIQVNDIIIALVEMSPPKEGHDAEIARVVDAIVAREKAALQTRSSRLLELDQLVSRLFKDKIWVDQTICPACESELAENLDDVVAKRLELSAAVFSAQATIKSQWTQATLRARVHRLRHRKGLPTSEETVEIDALDRRLSDGLAQLADVDRLGLLVAQLDARVGKELESNRTEKMTLEKELPPSLVALLDKVEAARAIKEALVDIAAARKDVASLQRRQEQRNRWISFITTASDRFAEAEVALSTAETALLEPSYKALYEKITSNPEIVPRLRKAAGTEQLFLELAKFYSAQDVSAPALLPESYRNALAISIFLAALTTKKNASARFILLDDVTSSFDAGHQYNLMEVIRTAVARPGVPTGPQVIILSHDTQLQKYFDRLGSQGGWRNQELQGLAPHGAVLVQAQGLDRIRDTAERFLDAGLVAQAEPLLRQFFEAQLLRTIQQLDIRVPIDFSVRDDRRMVGNCLDVITADIDLHEKAGALIMDPAQVQAFRIAIMPAIVANWVSHYSTGGGVSSLSPYVLKSLLKTIGDDLPDCFKYDCKCSGSLQRRSYRNLTKKACGC